VLVLLLVLEGSGSLSAPPAPQIDHEHDDEQEHDSPISESSRSWFLWCKRLSNPTYPLAGFFGELIVRSWALVLLPLNPLIHGTTYSLKTWP